MDAQHFLQTILPAGEWSNIKVVVGDGMMREHDWAILATADWQRRGGVPAFIKFIRAAGPSAGRETIIVTDVGRLKQVEERLNEVRRQPGIPLVPILELRMVLDKGLLLAMERVEVVQSLVDRGEAGTTVAVRLLRHLDPDGLAAMRAWHHFDVCARNIGIRQNGIPVLIDVESVYLESAGQIPVTVPAFKPGRLPERLRNEVLSSAIAKGIEIHLPAQLALRKFRTEVVVAAAECCFGSIPLGADPVAWLESLGGELRAVALGTALRRLDAGESFHLAAVASELEEAASKPVGLAPQAMKMPSAVPLEVALPRPSDVDSTRLGQERSQPSGWGQEFRELDGMARALRRGELGRDGIAEYHERLDAIVAKYPEASPVWSELLLVAVSYVRDRDQALAIVNRALEANREDRGFQQWKQILTGWRVR